MPERLRDTFVKPDIPRSIKVFPVKRLGGELTVPGDKVTAVHLLLATTIFQSETKINNIHYCGDVLRIVDWLRSMELTDVDQAQDHINIIPRNRENFVDLSDLADTRSNICLVSALALKYNKVIFKGTEGCKFTDRKVDKHFALMEAFGLTVTKQGGLFVITNNQQDRPVEFDCSTPQYGPSVGVTCHALIAGLVYSNKITLTNAALEFAPTTLIEYMKQSTNRQINVDGRTITIEAVENIEHKSNELELPPDITVACTYIAALTAVGNGELELKKISLKEIPPSVFKTYEEMGINISETGTRRLRITLGESRLQMPEEIICDVIPGFPTDVAPIYSASIAGLKGTTVITDKIYDKRSSHIKGLNEMGYDLEAQGNRVVVNGHRPQEKDEVTVEAEDIRAGAALIVGALGSNAKSVIITNYKQVYRGYATLVEDLRKLGANIEEIE